MKLIDINIGHGCNFRCSYCHEQYDENAYEDVGMTRDVVSKSVEYIKYIRECNKDEYIVVGIFGGEPLLYMDRISQLVVGVKDVVNTVFISTNGALIEENKSRILNLKSIFPSFKVSISYDFALQNESRQDGTYDIVREYIRWLYDNKLLSSITTCIDVSNLHRINEVFFDFIKLREELPGLKCRYNLSLYGDLSSFNEEGTKSALTEIRDYLYDHAEHYGSFIHNTGITSGRVGKDNHCWGHIVGGIDVDGQVYTSYCMNYRGNEVKEKEGLGDIFTDDFESIYNNCITTQQMVASTVPEECRTCSSTCRVTSWGPMLDGGDGKWNGMPNPKSCYIRKLVHEYMGEFRS